MVSKLIYYARQHSHTFVDHICVAFKCKYCTVRGLRGFPAENIVTLIHVLRSRIPLLTQWSLFQDLVCREP